MPSILDEAQQRLATPSLVIPGGAEAHLGGSMVGGVGDPFSYYPSLWVWAVKLLGVERVADIGCGHGYALQFFRDLGCTVYGVEGLPSAAKYCMERQLPAWRHDYEQGPLPLDPSFDLGWCCEFVEHIDEKFLPNFMATLKSCRVVLMTHAMPGQGGHHHVNEQLPEYWVAKFAEHGLKLDQTLTDCARLVAAADKSLLKLPGDNYFMRTGLAFVNQTPT